MNAIHRTTGAICLLITALLPESIHAQAPNAVAGLTITMTITGGQLPFASSGMYYVRPFFDGTYTVRGYGVRPSDGVYTYFKTGPSTGRLQFGDTAAGLGVMDLTFTSGNSGTYYLRGPSGVGGWQSGFFSFPSPWPTVVIRSPQPNALVTGGVVLLQGTARDDVEVTAVRYQLNNNAWEEAVGTTMWEARIVPPIGLNILRAYAVDRDGNASPTVSVRFAYAVKEPLQLRITGTGVVSPNYGNALLQIGRVYSMTAQAGAGQMFSNWTAGAGEVLTYQPTLRFTMQSNLVLQANFVPNPFIPLKGSYVGLFTPPEEDSVHPTNAGSVALTLTGRGAFSGSVRLAGKTHSLSGAFNLARRAAVTIPRLGSTPLSINLVFDTEGITGQVSTAGWAANALAVRRSTATSNAFAGRYSMLVMGQHDATDVPPGDSALAVSVGAAGAVSVVGTMADGSPVTLATGHADAGRWPLYASLYSGRGVVLGWLTCEANPASQEALWVKAPDAAARYYPAGFGEARAVALKRYLPPALKQTATSWTLGRLLLGGGNLPTPLEAEVLVTNNLIKRLSGTVSSLSLVITNGNGRFGGSFLHPVTRKATPLKGVVVQGLPWVAPAEQVTVGGGWFLGTNQGGYLWLEPKP